MYKFTFKTEREYIKERFKGFIESYDIVRMEVKTDYGSIDFPCKSEEDYYRCLKVHGANIQHVYQDTHSFDIMDYAECE
jgi:hypothetical protein